MARRCALAVLSLAGCFVSAAGAQPPAVPQEDPPPVPGWHSDIPTGFRDAKKSGKPLMVVFR